MRAAVLPALLLTLAVGACAPDAPGAETAPAAAADTAAAAIGFDPIPPIRIELPALSDEYVRKQVGTLDALLAGMATPDDSGRESRLHLWRFANRLRTGTLDDAQATMVVDHLQSLETEYPDARDDLERTAFVIENLRIGAIAPDITGKDVHGESLTLADYRGRVVLLVFSGQWCGPCRSEYPYQRLLTELYADKPFAIIGVNSDSLRVAETYQAENNLRYRAFRDGPTTHGPIATRWNVTGWPTIYLLDREGRIRFVDVRHEDALKAVGQLMSETPG